ncbi:MAG: F0F1 ATP synthase subunit B [Gemmataceae bacterium]|nr:F0F1 ATP synthase subunit B [Gemmataceae bacterium]
MRILWIAIVTFFLLVGTGPAYAADPAHKTGETASADAHHKDGLLDFKIDTGIWAAVVFLVLLLVLRKAAWGPMLEGLKKREESIKGAVEEAKRLREESARSEAAFKKQLDDAYAQIPKLLDEARRDAQAMAEEMRAKAAAEIQTERQRLHRELETARDQALHELWSQSATLATLISTKAIGRSMNADDHRRLVDEAVEELKTVRRN